MENKFTKGPWQIEKVITNVIIGGHPHTLFPIVTEWSDEDGDGIGIAVCVLPRADENKESSKSMGANQLLIAAAPELLEALQFCKSVIESNGLFDISDNMAFEKANKAINKATSL